MTALSEYFGIEWNPTPQNMAILMWQVLLAPTLLYSTLLYSLFGCLLSAVEALSHGEAEDDRDAAPTIKLTKTSSGILTPGVVASLNWTVRSL